MITCEVKMKGNKKSTTIFIAFDIEDKTTQFKDEKRITSFIELIIPHARRVESNSPEEIIYAIDTPETEDNFANRLFLIRLQSVFLKTQEYYPHFTTYAF